ncbi:MAG TPA: hypothetical protein VIG28_05295 [Leifsonia sp.]
MNSTIRTMNRAVFFFGALLTEAMAPVGSGQLTVRPSDDRGHRTWRKTARRFSTYTSMPDREMIV